MIKVSAPGKLLLFGDHAVVHERPCIVTSVDHRISVSLEKRGDDKIILKAPDVRFRDYIISINDLKEPHPKDVNFVLTAVLNFFEQYKLKSALEIKTKSEFSAKVGLGSSSAVTVSTIKGLSELFGIKMSNKELFDLSYRTILDIQEVGSGFDVAAAIYGGTLYFVTAGKTIEPLEIENIPLIVGYTGIKADTATLVKMVSRKLKENPKKVSKIFDKSEEIVNLARVEMEDSNWEKVGELMKLNQSLLRDLDVSSDKLESLIKASLSAGSYGAKLSGAGGGDSMVAIARREDMSTVENAIEKAGGKIIKVKIQAEGVKID